jgi:hypothetical protein
MTPRRARSAAAVLLLLTGCATLPAERPPGPPAGTLSAHPGRPGLVIAAPHGASESGTGEIAIEIARRTGFGVVVASGSVLEPDTPDGRDQVNRPTEGAPGRPPGPEAERAAARRVHDLFERRVAEAAQGRLRLYVEIGGSGRESPGQLQIATVGLGPDDAWRVRTLLELVRDARLRGHPGAPRLAVLVEPLEGPRAGASSPPPAAFPADAARALRIELPRSARTEWREVYTGVLAQFLVEVTPALAAPPIGDHPPPPRP